MCWVILKEMRAANKLRAASTLELPPLVDSWPCEICGAHYHRFDQLVHHQFWKHKEIFKEGLHERIECLCDFCEATRVDDG